MGDIFSEQIDHFKLRSSSPALSTFPPPQMLPFHDPFIIMDDLSPPESPVSKPFQVGFASEVSTIKRSEEIQEDVYPGHSARSDHAPINRFSTDELTAFDLHPPPPTESDPLCEVLVQRLYSTAHLNVILKNPTYFQHFRGFLDRHRPQCIPTLVRYMESQKALTAIRYANALADQMATHLRPLSKSSTKGDAAMIDLKFESLSERAMEELVSDALPTYITYRMITVVTECLVKEITGCNTPLMRHMVQGLAEVYCMSDPNQPDCPIVFASDGMIF
jgi:hypothetical protein